MQAEFLDLIDVKRWQVIQNYFSEVTGAGIRVVDQAGAPITVLSNPHKHCYKVISSSPKAFLKCRDCLILSPKPYTQDSLIKNPQYFLDVPSNIYYDTCGFQMNRIVIPVKADSQICAYIILGPVILGKRKTYPEYFNMSRELDMDVNEVIDCIELIRVFSFASIGSIVNLFQEIANFMVESGVEKLKKNKHKKPVIEAGKKEIPFYMDKMLQALFETAGEGVSADRGSIMVVDKSSNTLHIKLSKGIPNEIVSKAEVKIGEGLSGWAAQENKAVFIDKDFNNPRLLSRLHNPEIAASLIVPIKTGDFVFGVLNLSTKEKNHNFNKENINSIIQLTKMVDNALCNIAGKAQSLP